MTVFWATAVPFAPLTVTRLRGLDLGQQIPCTLFVSGILALPSLLWVYAQLMALMLIFVGLGYGLLPPAAALATSSRLARRPGLPGSAR